MTDKQKAWQEYAKQEMAILKPILEEKGLVLLDDQPHISGERFLMSGKKVVLEAKEEGSLNKLIIKSTSDTKYRAELIAEASSQSRLQEIPFAYHPLLAPEQRWLEKDGDRVTVATEYIEQPIPFLTLPLEKQFDLILDAFKMLAGVHVTTASHSSFVKKFKSWNAKNYLEAAEGFLEEIKDREPGATTLLSTVETGFNILNNKEIDIERFCGFLTHDDFALHNFRFYQDAIYLIDQSSLLFGNKHESWARLMNFMILNNRDLEQAILKYTKNNLSDEEQSSLYLMRIYKLIELINYHHRATIESVDNIKKLSERRITFWSLVLEKTIHNQDVDQADVEAYKKDRDDLRSPEEKARQKSLQHSV
jgi:hypothetical protein